MVQDTSFKGKYVVVKQGHKDAVYIDYGKILSKVKVDNADKYYLRIEVIQATGKDNWTPFVKGDIYNLYMGEFDEQYDIVDTKLEVITKLL